MEPKADLTHSPSPEHLPILDALGAALHGGQRVFLCPSPGTEAQALTLGTLFLERGIGACACVLSPVPQGVSALEHPIPHLERLGKPGDWIIALGGRHGPLGLAQLEATAGARSLEFLALGVKEREGLFKWRMEDGEGLEETLGRFASGVRGAISPSKGVGYFCHSSSVVDAGAEVGEGTKIWHFSHVQTGARIGKFCNLGQNVNVDRDAVIGDHVKVQNNVSIYKGVIVEDHAFLGPSCVFTNVVNPRSHVPRRHAFRETRVGQGASIGANATIVCGATIGSYAFIGAGAVVTHDVPSFALMVGVPARQLGWVCHCGERLLPENFKGEVASCTACGSRYHLENEGDIPRLKGIELVGGLPSRRPGGEHSGEQNSQEEDNP